MSHWEILEWCQNHGFTSPKNAAALLSTFNPDLEELEEWKIKEEAPTLYNINGDRYVIYSEEEAKQDLEEWKAGVSGDYVNEVPEELQSYIDWDGFWKVNSPSLDDYLFDFQKIIFRGGIYYVTETVNLYAE